MSRRYYSSVSATEICAFWGIVIAVALLIVTAFLRIFGASLGTIANILDLAAKIALLVAIALPAYGYVRGRSVGWKVTYWVALILYIVFIVLGAGFIVVK